MHFDAVLLHTQTTVGRYSVGQTERIDAGTANTITMKACYGAQDRATGNSERQTPTRQRLTQAHTHKHTQTQTHTHLLVDRVLHGAE